MCLNFTSNKIDNYGNNKIVLQQIEEKKQCILCCFLYRGYHSQLMNDVQKVRSLRI